MCPTMYTAYSMPGHLLFGKSLNLCAPGSFICVCARWPIFGKIFSLKTYCQGLGRRRTYSHIKKVKMSPV